MLAAPLSGCATQLPVCGRHSLRSQHTRHPSAPKRHQERPQTYPPTHTDVHTRTDETCCAPMFLTVHSGSSTPLHIVARAVIVLQVQMVMLMLLCSGRNRRQCIHSRQQDGKSAEESGQQRVRFHMPPLIPSLFVRCHNVCLIV